eukprot:TRINITY_DN2874_c0_g1_i1.p1 TRINITY_DN2874_c0_g1~~TRINITY_DN2874_c0_g1_i1.p1  ORF type:complete len:361 (-),score=67.22 TRINITY_DN2874_c0_g1_i1:201-1283(-)
MSADKTLEEIEQERMDRLVFGGGQKAVKTFTVPKPANQQAEPQKSPSGRTWSRPPTTQAAPQQTQQPQQPRKWEQKQQLVGSRLEGNMDLSNRVNYLNSLLDQGSITEEEYATRAEPIRVASEIINACINGDVNALRTVLQENPNFELDSIIEQEATPLAVAVTSITHNKGSPELVKLLLEQRSKADRTVGGKTPLATLCSYASCRNAAPVAKLLIQYGANAKATGTVQGSRSAQSCLACAVASGGSPELIEVLCQAGASARDEIDSTPMVNWCIIEGKTEHAITLLEWGADPNSREPSKGATCLASAIANGYTEVVKALLGRGASASLPVMRDQSMTAKELANHLASQGGAHAQIAGLM